MAGTHELSQGRSNETQMKLEKQEGNKFVTQIKNFLLTDEKHREAIFTCMSKDPTMKKVLDEFGQNEKTKNFVINQFFSHDASQPLALATDEHTYTVHWETSSDDQGQSVHIADHQKTPDMNCLREHIFVSNWKYPSLVYNQTRPDNGPQRAEGLEAKPQIQTFLSKLLK
jgi:hypothetical protein